eukprot:UN05151
MSGILILGAIIVWIQLGQEKLPDNNVSFSELCETYLNQLSGSTATEEPIDVVQARTEESCSSEVETYLSVTILCFFGGAILNLFSAFLAWKIRNLQESEEMKFQFSTNVLRTGNNEVKVQLSKPAIGGDITINFDFNSGLKNDYFIILP